MRNLTIAAALLMGGTSVIAQTVPPTAADAAAAQTIGGGAPATPAAAMPVADAAVTAAPDTSTAAATPMASGATAAPVATASADLSADADKDGALTPLEFAMHVDASNAALTAEAKRERFSRASGNGAIKLLNATAADFSKADKNQDRKVDATELAAWSGGAMTTASAPATMTSGAGTMTPMSPATADAAEPATGATMTPSEVSDAPADGQQADDTMATDAPPKN